MFGCICGGTFEVLITLVLTIVGTIGSSLISYVSDYFFRK